MAVSRCFAGQEPSAALAERIAELTGGGTAPVPALGAPAVVQELPSSTTAAVPMRAETRQVERGVSVMLDTRQRCWHETGTDPNWIAVGRLHTTSQSDAS